MLTGLRLLVAEAAPIVATSVGLLSARTAAYLVGFALGSIAIGWLPIIATLISLAGIFGGSTQECDNYRAELERIRLANEAARIAAAPLIKAWEVQYKVWQAGYNNYYSTNPSCLEYGPITYGGCVGGGGQFGIYCWTHANPPRCLRPLSPYPGFSIPYPTISYVAYSGCTPPNCPISKKVWLQTIWASQSDFATQTKSCFLIGYSYDKVDGVKIEYNPFKLSELFLKSRSANPDLIAGNRFTKLNEPTWKNLESTVGWDKGYWAAEQTDVECRGWNPGWSRKVK
ncbi:hypothetical protein [Microcoleus sp. PH2017_34_RAT_O_A]|uniref:hypothetical protein n=1 Tax=Microcoleus sp. PH2017_34_RAT_O_A TaxID=2798844 RepID=UPI0025DAC636|nr:hypothetical protein [Microcoleus sp. PH2017_34_RAT_O_A]